MLHAGYGTQDSRGRQSISIANLSSGQVKDFPDDRLAEESHQSYFVGLAFSADGKHLYASLGSITDPTGTKPGDTGNAIAVYSFREGKVAAGAFDQNRADRSLRLGSGWRSASSKRRKARRSLIRRDWLWFPPCKASRLLIANNLSDTAILIDAASGRIVHQFDLEHEPHRSFGVSLHGRRRARWTTAPGAVCGMPRRLRNSTWHDGEVVRRISLRKPESRYRARIASHRACCSVRTRKHLYVTLSNADVVAAISTADGHVRRAGSLPELHGQAYRRHFAGGASSIRTMESNCWWRPPC